MTEEDVADPCAECAGACCTFRRINISYRSLDPGERYDSHFLHADGHDQLVFDDGSVPDMDWYILTLPNGSRRIVFECNHLTDDGKCGAYDRRPSMCRNFECGALDDDADVSLDEFLANHKRPASFPSEHDIRDVTDRVRDILRRRSQAEGWGADDSADANADD